MENELVKPEAMNLTSTDAGSNSCSFGSAGEVRYDPDAGGHMGCHNCN